MSLTIIDRLREHAHDCSDKLALKMLRDGTQEVEQISYSQLDERAQAIAAVLQSKNLCGERVVILYPAGIEFVCAFFGCLYIGAVAVPGPPPELNRLKRTLPRLISILDDCEASAVLTESSSQLSGLNQLSEWTSYPEVLETDLIPCQTEGFRESTKLRPQDIAYLQYTSGSTSTPRGIRISHSNLLHQLNYLQHTCSYNSESATITWMPNFHDWGLIEGILEPIYNGTPSYLMAPISFVRRPSNWLSALSKYEGTHAQGPTFAYAHCSKKISTDEISQFDLSR